MRIDPDTCRDPDLLAAEVRRLRNVLAADDPWLTDAERDDLRVWLAECLRQASTATEGGNEELAERWRGRSRRAAAMLERLGGDHAHRP